MTHRRDTQPADPNQAQGTDSWLEELLLPAEIDTNSIAIDEAPFVREALVRAQALRVIHEDPGNAYMQGVTDALNYVALQRTAKELAEELHYPDLTEPPA